MIDAVLSYHANLQTCGVTKFNAELAKRLNVPHANIMDAVIWLGSEVAPLISIKPTEMEHPPHEYFQTFWDTYDVMLHDRSLKTDSPTIRRARRVFYADEIGCPSTINGNPHRGAYRVLVFGMAHKLNLPHFEQLKEQLDREHPDYTIELSTAVHEGHPWDEALAASIESLRRIFDVRLRVLGYLGDDALARLLQEVDAVALYYMPALRANNTTYWAAVDAGKIIYTNRDDHSPQEGDPPASWDRLIELIRG